MKTYFREGLSVLILQEIYKGIFYFIVVYLLPSIPHMFFSFSFVVFVKLFFVYNKYFYYNMFDYVFYKSVCRQQSFKSK